MGETEAETTCRKWGGGLGYEDKNMSEMRQVGGGTSTQEVGRDLETSFTKGREEDSTREIKVMRSEESFLCKSRCQKTAGQTEA